MGEYWLMDYLEEHPEIRSVSLVWVWPFRAIVVDDYGAGDEDDVLIAEGLEIDPEYTYTGSNADARRYLDSYRVWNYVEEGDVKVENGVLSVFNVGELHDEDDFDDRLPVLVYSMKSALVPLSVYEGAPYGLGFGKLCRHMGVEL